MNDGKTGPGMGAGATVVTAGDGAYAWGVLLLTGSMRKNGMNQPVVVGAMDWPDKMKGLVRALGNVTLLEFPRSKQCVACQKPMLMAHEAVKTDWVCWADADGLFVGDCSEWLQGDDAGEITIRRYDPPPPDFSPGTLAVWRRDVERHCGGALPESRLTTRVNTAFIVVHRRWRAFLGRWRRQLEAVLPSDVGIVMQQGTAYFQTDESVLASLLCFDPEAPEVTTRYKANGSADKSRYYVHFAYNPKPWQMWNAHAARWREEAYATVDWLLSEGVVRPSDVPLPLRRDWWPVYRALAPAAPLVWRAKKLKRKVVGH